MKNGKGRKFIHLLVVTGIFLGACSAKHESTENDAWAELDSFHMIIAEAYHPLKDSSNLEPAKASADLLAAEAERWASAELPEKMDNQEMKAMLAQLSGSAKGFADKVKSGATDEELGTALTALHGEFHNIMEAWEGNHEHH